MLIVLELLDSDIQIIYIFVGQVNDANYPSNQRNQYCNVEHKEDPRGVQRSKFELEELDVVGHGDKGSAAGS